MSPSLLVDAFGHHVWATLRLLDVCSGLDAGGVDAVAPGTYGSIIATLRHLVGADASYLYALTDGTAPLVDTDSMTVAALRKVMERHGPVWEGVLAGDPDPEAIVVRVREDGSASHAPAGIRLAQALHHGTDHRSQVCTVLTTIGFDPPGIDVWDYADQDGRLVETPATS